LGRRGSPRHWPELATFFNYPEAVRRQIYTTNPIESLNSRVRKTVKGKSVFPTEIALFKALYLAVAEAEKRWTMRTRNWQEIMAQLAIFFQERLKDYLCGNINQERLHSFWDTPKFHKRSNILGQTTRDGDLPVRITFLTFASKSRKSTSLHPL
jgi:hypothetical protein